MRRRRRLNRGKFENPYRKLQAFADGGAVAEAPQVPAAPIPDPVIEPDELDQSGLPDSAKAWLRANQTYLHDESASAKVAALHVAIVDEGRHEEYSPGYFAELERRLKPSASGDVDQEAVDRVLAQARRSAPPRP